MIEIQANKDIGSYEPKILGPFTLRQLVCLSIAVPVGWKLYSTFSPYLSDDLSSLLLFIPALIAFLFGWYKPFGIRVDKFLQVIFVNVVLAPSHRKFKTENRQEDAVHYLEEISDLYKQANTTDQSDSQKHFKKKEKIKYSISDKAVL